MDADQNCKGLLRIFDRHRVRFLVVSGFAVMLYSEPYATKNLDVWVEPTAENALRVFAALAEFGAPLTGATPLDFTNPDHIYQIGVDYVRIRIDILMNIAELVFSEAWEHRNVVEFEGQSTPSWPKRTL
jgi:hypothetical protein